MKNIILTLLVLLSGIACFPQSSTTVLQQNFSSGDFPECIKNSTAILKKDTEDPQANFFKGASLIRMKKYSNAETCLIKAAQNKYQPAVAVHTNLLRAYAGQKQTEKVLKKLGDLAANGFGSLFVLNGEEFSYLEHNREYINLKKKVDENANPCKYGNDYKRLDFWIGEWDVYVNDTKTADSEISKSVGGCTLHEDYRTLSGFLGRSMSYFDPVDKLYKQIWIDKFNSIVYFKETKSKEGYLQMLAENSNGNLSRMTYTYDPKADSVTQTMEASNDNGKTWSTNFTGVYKRKSKEQIEASGSGSVIDFRSPKPTNDH